MVTLHNMWLHLCYYPPASSECEVKGMFGGVWGWLACLQLRPLVCAQTQVGALLLHFIRCSTQHTPEGMCCFAWTHQKGCVALLGHTRRAALLCLDTPEGLCCFAWTHQKGVLLCLDTSEGLHYFAWTHQKGCVALLGHIRRGVLLCLDTSEGLLYFAWTHQKGCVALLGHIRRAVLLCLDISLPNLCSI